MRGEEDFPMPLRDHFRQPIVGRRRWDAFLGQWPAMIVVGLDRSLPERYVAGPLIQVRSVATTDPPGQYTYEVHVYDTESGERLVAAVEIVSTANKDRPEHRRAFIAKCAALLQEGVCVAIVDLFTTRTSNLFRELMEFLGQPESSFPDDAPSLYAVALRWTDRVDQWVLEVWVNPLTLGCPLPLWLAEDLAIPLELEPSYEETCRILHIPSP
jgi:hypothetical protein